MKLGRRVVPVPPGTPSLRAHAILTQRAPERLLRDRTTFAPGMFLNDELSDCTCATTGNLLRAAAVGRGYTVTVTDQDALALYERSGYLPGRPETDQGDVIAEMLGRQTRQGWALASEQVPAPLLFANVPAAADLNAVRLVMARANGCYLGIRLSPADMESARRGEPWTGRYPASYGDATPSNTMGHALFAWSYDGTDDADTVWLGTWGMWQACTWERLRVMLDEAHLVTWPQFGGVLGVDAEQLAADCGCVEPSHPH